MLKRTPRAVTTITPQRVSFVGGGTDLPAFYSEHGGEVISSAIDQYVYVTVKRHSELFQEQYRLSYSKTEHADSLDAIENDIARECLRMVRIDYPLYIATAADLPASSGLGSSSSFAVGLLNALHLMKGERVSAAQLAEEACEIEINILGNPIGKQDQYAAAFGGLNHIKFRKNGRVEIDHMVLQNNLIEKIFDNCLLIWTGIQRDASSVLSRQSESLQSKVNYYKSLVSDVGNFKNLLLSHGASSFQALGELLENSWATKQQLEGSISSSCIDDIHHKTRTLGGYGGKLSGAGGGGFLLEIVPIELQMLTLNHFGPAKVLKVTHEPLGSRLMSEVY